ncbi:MAG: isoprenylcysteine carboxylmethyltransferase family protein [Pseudomonadota bacterium]
MAMKEEFERTGNWLFRWRSYLPLIMLSLFTLALYQYPGGSEYIGHMWEIACLFISFVGLAIRIKTIGHTPKGTSGRNTKSHEAHTLNTTGMYSIVRNPLYLGNYFMGLGLALFAHLWWLVVIYTLLFWLYYERIIFSEEGFLREKFGQEYLTWANRTPAMIPKIRRYEKAELSFSLKNVLKREYNGAFAVVILVFFLDTMEEYFHAGILTLDKEWLLFVSVFFCIWLTLRSLNRYTRILNVEGR